MRRERFEELKAHRGRHQRPDLDAWYEELDAVGVDDMLGSWKGGVFATGNLFEKPLAMPVLRWHGKRFDSADRVEALVGKALGFRFAAPLGSAVLRPVEFRGKVSAAMIYDRLPIIDHFRAIDEDAVMGIMDRKGKIEVYFYLERESDREVRRI